MLETLGKKRKLFPVSQISGTFPEIIPKKRFLLRELGKVRKLFPENPEHP